MEEFESVASARSHANTHRKDYDGYRPRSSLGGLPPTNSLIAVLIPLCSLRSISTAKANFSPKSHSHYSWIKNGGIPGASYEDKTFSQTVLFYQLEQKRGHSTCANGDSQGLSMPRQFAIFIQGTGSRVE
jgi:hypothetical protein